MRLILVAVGERIPSWVEQGFKDYAGRLRRPMTLELIEIPASRRSRNSNIPALVRAEGKRLLAAVPVGWQIIALDSGGRQYDTVALAERFRCWIDDAYNAALLVGGPDGLSNEVLNQADEIWSLSALTFAHSLVRVVVAEQVYRASSILQGLPYHRGTRFK